MKIIIGILIFGQLYLLYLITKDTPAKYIKYIELMAHKECKFPILKPIKLIFTILYCFVCIVIDFVFHRCEL